MASLTVDVRKLAALDMALHGKPFIVIEFAFGVAGCLGLGALSLSTGVRLGAAWVVVLGAVLISSGVNYIPLFIHAVDLARKGSARQEAAYEVEHRELIWRYTVLQLWIVVPFAMVVMDLAQRARSRA